jgi:hypothetical protein
MKRIVILAGLALLVMGNVAWSEIPKTISYQGVLRIGPGDNEVAPDGNYNFTFRLYTAPTGGPAQWEDTLTVRVSHGRFNVLLGTHAQNPLNLPFDQQYYLGTQVSGQAEMVPRVQLAASPYSLNGAWKNGHIVAGSNMGSITFDPSNDGVYTVNGTTDFSAHVHARSQLDVTGQIKQFRHSESPSELQMELGSNADYASLELYHLSTNGEIQAYADDEPKINLLDSNGNQRITLIARTTLPAVRVKNSSGQARAVLWVDNSGCGRLSLDNSSGGAGINLNGCSPLVQVTNSQGEVTIEIDGETGNIYYSGDLIKKNR